MFSAMLYPPELLDQMVKLAKPKRQGSAGAPGPRRENSMVFRYKRGDIVGKLELLEPKGKGKWLTKCECGRVGIRSPGNSKSCLWCREPSGKMKREGGELYVREELSRPHKTANGRSLTIGYNTAYWNAKRKSLDFTLTRAEYTVLRELLCEYCGGGLPEKGSGLDRKDCTLGYTADNVVPCCTTCNRVKGEAFSHTEMKQLGELVRQLLNERGSVSAETAAVDCGLADSVTPYEHDA